MTKPKPKPFIFAGLDDDDLPIIRDLEGNRLPFEPEEKNIADQYEGYLDKKKYIDCLVVEYTNPTWVYIRGKKVKIG